MLSFTDLKPVAAARVVTAFAIVRFFMTRETERPCLPGLETIGLSKSCVRDIWLQLQKEQVAFFFLVVIK